MLVGCDPFPLSRAPDHPHWVESTAKAELVSFNDAPRNELTHYLRLQLCDSTECLSSCEPTCVFTTQKKAELHLNV